MQIDNNCNAKELRDYWRNGCTPDKSMGHGMIYYILTEHLQSRLPTAEDDSVRFGNKFCEILLTSNTSIIALSHSRLPNAGSIALLQI